MTPHRLCRTLDTLRYDNRFVRELPGDPETKNTRRQVTGACYSSVTPTPVASPKLAAISRDAARLLGLDPGALRSDLFARVMGGNEVLPGMAPFAMNYGGHQFGSWAGQLGDGRAINLGEIINPKGERWVIQLKGAGPTPYSRMADGLAVLRSSIREFLCSEAMFHLGIPTTRALSLVTTGESVERDMFYDGHPRDEPGAVVCRLSPSFIRFGNFQLPAARGDVGLLRQLTEYTIQTDFPHLGAPGPEVYVKWFHEICERTCDLVLHWQRVGFVHGVMNTDNMSILGLTIDYGPYGWLEDYNPMWTPNTTDAAGRRYSFQNQPQAALWNLAQLGNAVYPLVEDADALKSGLDAFSTRFRTGWQEMMAAKLGFAFYDPATDADIIKDLFGLLQAAETDFTLFFRGLAGGGAAESRTRIPSFVAHALYRPSDLSSDYPARLNAWLDRYGRRISRDGLPDGERRRRMNRVNPKYVLRNYLAQQAIDKAETGDFSLVEELLAVMGRPYEDQPGKEQFARKRPEWARHRPGCSMLSCSS